jgi:hypothetical protein
MAKNIIHHSAAPTNEKTFYSDFDTAEFILSNEGRSLVMGSVRIEGELEMTVEGQLYGSTDVSYDSTVYLDQWAGAHSLCEQISVSAAGMTLETLSDYPRLVAAMSSGTQSQTDLFNSQNVCELRTSSQELSREVLMGEYLQLDPNDVAVARANPDFSFKPVTVLNNSAGVMPYRQVGPIKMTINLARIANVVYGPGAAASAPSYVLRNLRCVWRSVPDDGKKVAIDMVRHLSDRADIQSSQASIQLRMPAVCSSVFSTFISDADSKDQNSNTLALQRLPGVSVVEFLFSSATNTLLTYRLQSEVEVLERYIDALSNGSGTNGATLRNIYSNNVYGIGLSFGGELDLNAKPLTVQITSEVTNGAPWVMVNFFRSQLSL